MEHLTLYFCPITCARVTMVALEQAGADYDTRLVNLMAGEQKSSEYLAINPGGKVPALRVGDRILTENAAILIYLDGCFPEAGLLPAASDPLLVAQARSDVIWCATTLHLILRQLRAPYHYTLGDPAPVKAKGLEVVATLLPRFEARFTTGPWWFGADWSIVDTYLNWVIGGWASSGVDLAAYPAVAAHGARVTAQPSFKRMFEREGEIMAEAGMQLPPGLSR